MRSLYVELFLVWGIIILTWILGEMGIIPNGELVAQGQQFEFYVDVAIILLTIVCVPLALKLFSLNTQRGLRRMDKDEALSAYHRWSIVRLALLFLCAELGVLVYFLLIDDKGAYCTGIALVATLFCIPSENKVKEFLTSKEEEEEIA